MDLFILGFLAGALLVGAVCFMTSISYKNLLRGKALDGSAECLNGEFYMIVPEAEYLRLKGLK